MHPPTIIGRQHHVIGSSVRLSVRCPLTPISRDVIFPYLVQGFE